MVIEAVESTMGRGMAMTWVSGHQRESLRVLSSLKKELEKRRIDSRDDKYWTYHILVPLGKCFLSLYCGGFSKVIDVAHLTERGVVDRRFKERSFMTVKGAANYIGRLLDVG